jgi:MoaA/NifB/PqqE/SkfB family radical SAM enzyme
MSVPAGSKSGYVLPLIDLGINYYRLAESFSAIAQKYKLYKIKTVGIYINDLCNLNCKHCYYTRDNKLNENPVPLEKLKSFINACISGDIKLFAFVGKEVFLPGADIGQRTIELLKFLSSKKQNHNILLGAVTNGTKINLFIPELKNLDIDYIDFSIDGPDAKTHEALRGENTFNITIKNLEKSISEKIAKKIFIASTLYKGNLNSLYKIIHLGNSIGVKHFNINPIVAIKGDHLAISINELANFINEIFDYSIKTNTQNLILFDIDSYIIDKLLPITPFHDENIKIDYLNNILLIKREGNTELVLKISPPDPCNSYACISADGLYFDKGGCLFMGNEYENKSLGPINPDLILKHEQKVLKILNTLNSTLLQKSSDEILTKFEGISYALPKIN